MDIIKCQYDLILHYETFKGSQTSMGTLYITPKKSLLEIKKLICVDMESKNNIKSPENKF
jgi:peptide subunit release factor 1 (eRF1)